VTTSDIVAEVPAPSDARALARFLKSKRGVAGAILVGIVTLVALLAPVLDAHPPDGKNVKTGLSELGEPLAPSAEYPLGTDVLGRCNAARLVHGARISLTVGILATVIALVIGMMVGLVAGYARGTTDSLLMRFVDLVLAFPFLLLVIAVAAALQGGAEQTTTVALVLGLVGWTTMARVVRGKTLTLRELPFVEAARAVGAGHVRVLARHIAINMTGTIAVLATISIAQMILAESVLSYLGLGAPPPAATWGRMLSEGQPYLKGAPWLVFAPGAAILLTVLGFNLLGEGLRDAFDPTDAA
jgi:peptide/nickel transport system permease protein